MKKIEEVIHRFRQEGYKITPQRRAIFEILLENGNHPKAEDIYREIKERMPDISRMTIYNTLNELKALGMVDVVHVVGDDVTRYDPNTEVHHHLYCLNCNRIVDVEPAVYAAEISEEKFGGFHVIKQQITFFGYCPDCQKLMGGDSKSA